MKIIGIDSAVQDKNIGMVLCVYNDSKIHLSDKWDKTNSFESQIERWLDNDRTILAVDSPLGWPKEFSSLLESHLAGMTLGDDDRSFFKRETDVDIAQRYKKIPLEVSADRIARTAFHTLRRLSNLRALLKRKMDIIWNPKDDFDLGFIEVYPASTLLANEVNIKGYKSNEELRREIYGKIITNYNLTNERNIDIFKIEHDFDAFICCLAGFDFIENRSKSYRELNETIRKEGWIWTKE